MTWYCLLLADNVKWFLSEYKKWVSEHTPRQRASADGSLDKQSVLQMCDDVLTRRILHIDPFFYKPCSPHL